MATETAIAGGGPEELRILAVKLRAADAVTRKAMRARLRGAARPVRDRVRAAALAMPSHHNGTLRGEIARSVSTSLRSNRAGVMLTVMCSPGRMPRGERRLPAYTDAARGWGHPVFAIGPRASWHWVHQTAEPGWFERAGEAGGRDAHGALQGALDDVKRYLS
jgi:hypothetical protein